jgi:CHAT domain-containing protein
MKTLILCLILLSGCLPFWKAEAKQTVTQEQCQQADAKMNQVFNTVLENSNAENQNLMLGIKVILLQERDEAIAANPSEALKTKYTETIKITKRLEELLSGILKVKNNNNKIILSKNAYSYEAQADKFEKNNNYSAAIEPLKKALEIRRKIIGDNQDITKNLYSLSEAYIMNREPAKALPLAKEMIAITEKNLGLNHRDVSLMKFQLGRIYSGIGQFENANNILQESEKVAELNLKGKERMMLAEILNARADSLAFLNNPMEAIANRKKALAIFRNIEGENGREYLNCLFSLGSDYWILNDDTMALQTHMQALQNCEKYLEANDPLTTSCTRAVGNDYENIKQYGMAIPYLLKALSNNQSMYGIKSPLIEGDLYSLGQAYHDMGDIPNAQKLIEPWVENVNSQIPALFALGEEQRLAAARTKFNFSHLVGVLSAVKISTCILRWKGSVLDSLMDDQQVYTKNCKSDNSKNILSQIQELKSQIVKAQILGNKNNAANIYRIQQRIDDLECSYSNLNRFKTHNYSSLKIEDVISSLGSNECIVDFISFISTNVTYSYGASIVCNKNPPSFITLEGATDINKAVISYRKAIATGDEASLKTQIQILSDKLLKQIASALPPDTKKIYIGADGPLNFLSFATLQDDQGKFLSEKYQIAYVGSGRDLLRPAKSIDEKRLVLYANPDFSVCTSTNSVAVADTNFADARGMKVVELAGYSKVQLPQLPGTEQEAAIVAQIAKEAQWSDESHLGANASKKGLMTMKAPGILHLATHGFFLGGEESGGEGERGMKVAAAPDASSPAVAPKPKPLKISPMRQSGVALTGGQSTLQAWGRGEFPDPSNDGILTAEEVAGLDLDGTWLVTLSACETGVGQVQSGEGVFGLRRAFMMSGAQNLLMTLWPVSDEVTPKIMADFYKKALATGDAAGSLSDVQRDWLVKLRDEKGLLAAVRDAGPFAMVVMSNPNAKLLPEAAPSTVSSSESISAVSTVSPNTSEGSNVIEFSDAISKADTGDAKAQAIVAIYYGLGYKTEKDLAKAAEYASKSAAQSDPLGQYQLGVLTSSGDGVPKDPEKGKRLKVQSIEGLNTMADDPYALAALGAMALRGEGVAKDMKKAAKLYQKSADLGYAPAQILYATMLSKGVGVQKDDDEAMRYMGKASEQNFSSQ